MRLRVGAAQYQKPAVPMQFLDQHFKGIEGRGIHGDYGGNVEDDDLAIASTAAHDAVELIRSSEEQCAKNSIDQDSVRNVWSRLMAKISRGRDNLVKCVDLRCIADPFDEEKGRQDHPNLHSNRQVEYDCQDKGDKKNRSIAFDCRPKKRNSSHSPILIETTISTAPRTVSEMNFARGAATKMIRSKLREWIIPATGEVAPQRMFVAVRAITPVTGSPPKKGTVKLAIPCAISSWFESCRSSTIPSATTAESSDSIAPSSVIAMAGRTRSPKWAKSNAGI